VPIRCAAAITEEETMSDNKIKPAVTTLSSQALAAIAATGALALAQPAAAIDVDAAEYQPVPPGTNLALLYYQHVERDALYASGDRVPGKLGLDSDIGIFRYLHYTDIGGFLAAPEVLVPFGHLGAKGDAATLGGDAGIGDLLFGFPTWLVNNAKARQYFGVTPYLFAPTGSYDHNNPINLGANRWAFALQAGYLGALTDKLHVNLTGDVTVFGKNNRFGAAEQTLKQEPLYELQLAFHYNVLPNLDLRAGYDFFFGGTTSVDGINQHNASHEQKYYVGAAWFVVPSAQFLFTYGQDTTIDNGFREANRFNFRLLKAF
jgi:hypothetical protein